MCLFGFCFRSRNSCTPMTWGPYRKWVLCIPCAPILARSPDAPRALHRHPHGTVLTARILHGPLLTLLKPVAAVRLRIRDPFLPTDNEDCAEMRPPRCRHSAPKMILTVQTSLLNSRHRRHRPLRTSRDHRWPGCTTPRYEIPTRPVPVIPATSLLMVTTTARSPRIHSCWQCLGLLDLNTRIDSSAHITVRSIQP